MVDIKGLEKARVLKALYDYSGNHGVGRFMPDSPAVTVEFCETVLKVTHKFDGIFGRGIGVDLSGDEFDEYAYDHFYGSGAAKRAVDSIRGEQVDAAENTDGENKELSMEEKAKLAKETISKILEILVEQPPDVSFAAGVMLKAILPGVGGMGLPSMMGGMFMPPMGMGRPSPFDISGKGLFR